MLYVPIYFQKINTLPNSLGVRWNEYSSLLLPKWFHNPREVALTNEIARLTQLTEAHRACTLRATHEPNYVPLNQRYDEPPHEWEIFRACAKINPANISSCVDTDIISTLAMAAGGSPVSNSIKLTMKNCGRTSCSLPSFQIWPLPNLNYPKSKWIGIFPITRVDGSNIYGRSALSSINPWG
ncbi:hypothetical protein P9112_001115 [Eukaryota sp. TZLM1-RC]